jgi:uncharacterized protein YabN with tetrapyrrole methylase and pyrophosphatase domain
MQVEDTDTPPGAPEPEPPSDESSPGQPEATLSAEAEPDWQTPAAGLSPDTSETPASGPNRGALVAVGTGIRMVGQLTMEALAEMRAADKLLYCIGDPIAEHIVRQLNSAGAESLFHYYAVGKQRIETYEQMIQRMLECVRGGLRTCVALYGHPGVFAYPAHEAIRRARAEGYQARMLPAVSAEDCLFADVGVDPAMTGCQSYEATDFMVNDRVIDNSASLILWQIGVLGDWSYSAGTYDTSSMPLLLERLAKFYPLSHEAIIYEASVFPGCPAVMRQTPLYNLANSGVSATSTLYIPPARTPSVDPGIYWRVPQLARGQGR